MALHHTIGTMHPLPCGLVECHGMFFADDSYGNMVRVDVVKGITFLVADRDLV